MNIRNKVLCTIIVSLIFAPAAVYAAMAYGGEFMTFAPEISTFHLMIYGVTLAGAFLAAKVVKESKWLAVLSVLGVGSAISVLPSECGQAALSSFIGSEMITSTVVILADFIILVIPLIMLFGALWERLPIADAMKEVKTGTVTKGKGTVMRNVVVGILGGFIATKVTSYCILCSADFWISAGIFGSVLLLILMSVFLYAARKRLERREEKIVEFGLDDHKEKKKEKKGDKIKNADTAAEGKVLDTEENLIKKKLATAEKEKDEAEVGKLKKSKEVIEEMERIEEDKAKEEERDKLIFEEEVAISKTEEKDFEEIRRDENLLKMETQAEKDIKKNLDALQEGFKSIANEMEKGGTVDNVAVFRQRVKAELNDKLPPRISAVLNDLDYEAKIASKEAEVAEVEKVTNELVVELTGMMKKNSKRLKKIEKHEKRDGNKFMKKQRDALEASKNDMKGEKEEALEVMEGSEEHDDYKDVQKDIKNLNSNYNTLDSWIPRFKKRYIDKPEFNIKKTMKKARRCEIAFGKRNDEAKELLNKRNTIIEKIKKAEEEELPKIHKRFDPILKEGGFKANYTSLQKLAVAFAELKKFEDTHLADVEEKLKLTEKYLQLKGFAAEYYKDTIMWLERAEEWEKQVKEAWLKIEDAIGKFELPKGEGGLAKKKKLADVKHAKAKKVEAYDRAIMAKNADMFGKIEAGIKQVTGTIETYRGECQELLKEIPGLIAVMAHEVLMIMKLFLQNETKGTQEAITELTDYQAPTRRQVRRLVGDGGDTRRLNKHLRQEGLSRRQLGKAKEAGMAGIEGASEKEIGREIGKEVGEAGAGAA